MKQSSQKNSNETYSLEFLASLTNSKLAGDANLLIDGVSSIELATASQITFLSSSRYKSLVSNSKASAIIVPEDFQVKDGKNYLVSKDPSRSIQKILCLFCKRDISKPHIHPSAIISPSANIHPTVSIAAGCIISDAVKIEPDVIINENSVIQKNTTIGKNSLIHASVVIQENCVLGENVIVQAGAIIGSCGYGYFTDNNANHEKIEHFGNVILEDDVEIGANTTIDRARINSTIIGKGTKIDNLVQIGHNVIVGQKNLIVAQTGISGSSTTGDRVILGGQTGVVGHVQIADDVILTAKGAFSKSVLQKGIYRGAPAQPIKKFNKNSVLLKNIDKPIQKINDLEKKIALLEEKIANFEKITF